MMKDAKAKKLKRVVVKDVSRFARNTVDLLQSIRELKSYGIQVDFLNNGEVMEGGSEFILTILVCNGTGKKVPICLKGLNSEKTLQLKKVEYLIWYLVMTKFQAKKYTLKINEEEAKNCKRNI